ncbi:hypothetical protein GCM10020255_083090 [Rhodococcus baikonurensis]
MCGGLFEARVDEVRLSQKSGVASRGQLTAEKRAYESRLLRLAVCCVRLGLDSFGEGGACVCGKAVYVERGH